MLLSFTVSRLQQQKEKMRSQFLLMFFAINMITTVKPLSVDFCGTRAICPIHQDVFLYIHDFIVHMGKSTSMSRIFPVIEIIFHCHRCNEVLPSYTMQLRRDIVQSRKGSIAVIKTTPGCGKKARHTQMQCLSSLILVFVCIFLFCRSSGQFLS